MALTLSVRRAKLQVFRDAILAGGGGAVHIYGSVYPGQDAASGDAPLMIRALEAADLVMHATDAYMAINAEANVALSGTPTWARFVDGTGAPVYDCLAGLPGTPGAALVVSNGEDPPSSAMYPGGVVTLSIEFVEAG